MHTTIKKIQKRGYLKVGVSLGILGLSHFNESSRQWAGFDVDIARSLAAAILGESDAIECIPLQSGERFQALQSQIIDIGTFNATITLSREVNHNLTFMDPLLYDGEAFMVRKDCFRKAGSIENMPSRIVTVLRGSTTLTNLRHYFSKKNLDYDVMFYESPEDALRAYEDNTCTIHCLDRILLAGERQRLKQPDAHIILQDIVTQEAMSPVVSSDDPFWVRSVRWILKALIEAEELEISRENLAEKKKQASDYINQFLDPPSLLCSQLGLPRKFTENCIAQVGNYADIFHKNIGNLSKLLLSRGENELRSKGGLLFSPLFL